MLSKWVKRLIGVAVLALLVVAVVYALAPRPVAVDLAEVDRGAMDVTVTEEGIARIRDVYLVSAPVTGRVDRLPVEIGEVVHRNTTTVASIHPVDPAFHDIRSRRELQAAEDAARAGVELAKAQVSGAEAGRRLAQAELERAERLADLGTISKSALDKAAADLDTAEAQVEEAKATLALRESELSSAEARLIEPDQLEGGSADACCMTLRAPVDGIVIKLLTESEQVVSAGASLLEIGDPRDLEVIVHLLSSDAVNIDTGSRATLDGWGGGTLEAKVRRIDPAAYTKVSALGIEEQRVDAILDLVDPREAWERLGHEFRVMVHIAIWQEDDVIRVPLGALFRLTDEWAVFKVVDDRAVVTSIEIGQRNNKTAQVLNGLSPGDLVILHPSDSVVDGVAVTARQSS